MDEIQDRRQRGESTANMTWSRMLAGNRRFAEGQAEHPWQDTETRLGLVNAQSPDAAIFSCSDSRVPPEIIFDLGLGDLYTVRTNGLILDPSVLSSLEFAITELQISLLVVMGHEDCSAVSSVLQTIQRHQGSSQVGSDQSFVQEHKSPLVRQVGSSIMTAKAADLGTRADYESVHIARTIEALVDGSDLIRQSAENGQIMIVGARYLLRNGKVQVLSF